MKSSQTRSEEKRRLAEKRRAGDLPFDLRPLPSASLDDLDLDLFRESYLPAALAPDVLVQNERTTEQQLASARFLGPNGHPTVAGILTLGYEPTRFVPGAYVQFLRLDGTDLMDPVRAQKVLSGQLLQVLRALEELIRINISVAVDLVTQPMEVRTPDYPVRVLEQLVCNAVMSSRSMTAMSPPSSGAGHDPTDYCVFQQQGWRREDLARLPRRLDAR